MLERLFSRESPFLPLILKAQLAFLAGLAVMAFVLPLSGTQRWIVVLAPRACWPGLPGPSSITLGRDERGRRAEALFERLRRGSDAKPDQKGTSR